jgi:hypothetical protein
MKALTFVGLMLLICSCNSSSDKSNGGSLSASLVNNPRSADGLDKKVAADKPTMDFVDTLHDFGSIAAEQTVVYDFKFANNGRTPLVISQAMGSCGCTATDYPQAPVAPGASGVVKVSFNTSGKKGHQEKTVTVHDNTLLGVHTLYITAEVKAN